MRFAVDSVRELFSGLVVVSGWSERGLPILIVDGVEYSGAHVKIPRPDVGTIFGAGAEAWGWAVMFRVPVHVDLTGNARVAILDDGGELTLVDNSLMPIDAAMQSSSILEDFIAAIRDAGGGNILEIGSRARSGRSSRNMFGPNLQHVGLDIMAGPNVDVVGDVHNLPVEFDNRFDFAVSFSTFEHLIMPWKAALELNKALKKGGIAYIQSHQTWPIHEEPWDFFRFSKYSWTGLFNAHTGFAIVKADHWHRASIVPAFSVGEPLKGLGDQYACMLSACIAKKIDVPKVEWTADPAEITDLNYSHVTLSDSFEHLPARRRNNVGGDLAACDRCRDEACGNGSKGGERMLHQ